MDLSGLYIHDEYPHSSSSADSSKTYESDHRDSLKPMFDLILDQELC